MVENIPPKGEIMYLIKKSNGTVNAYNFRYSFDFGYEKTLKEIKKIESDPNFLKWVEDINDLLSYLKFIKRKETIKKLMDYSKS